MTRTGEAEADLRRAIHILSSPGKYQPEEWMLIATLIAEAGRALGNSTSSELLREAVAALRDATRDFTDAEFIGSSRAARRRNPELFRSGSSNIFSQDEA